MAKVTTFKVRGVSSYAMMYSPDEYNDKRFWKINLHVTKEMADKVREAGLQNKLKDDPGNIPNASGKFFTFKLDCEKEFVRGKTYFCPPQILDRNGEKLVYYKRDGTVMTQYDDPDRRPDRVGETILIGNGSEVEVALEVYQTKRFGKGGRMKSVRIIDIVEYDPDKEDEEVEAEVQTEQEVKEEKPAEKKKSKVTW